MKLFLLRFMRKIYWKLYLMTFNYALIKRVWKIDFKIKNLNKKK